MLKFELLCLWKTKSKTKIEAEKRLLENIKPYAKVVISELQPRGIASLEIEQRKRKEADLVLQQLDQSNLLIALDETGETLSTEEFTETLAAYMNNGHSNITFIIGGAYGLDPSVVKKADYVLSLSKMTFTSQIARFILIEQLYRFVSIFSGKPYHK